MKFESVFVILAMLITVIRTQKNLTEVLEDIPKLSEFKVLLENTTFEGDTLLNNLETYVATDAITVFAPVNAALKDITVPSDNDERANMLTYYAIIKKGLNTTTIKDQVNSIAPFLVESYQGKQIRFNLYNDQTILTAQGSQLDQNIPDNTDIALNNGGFLHVVLDVMTAPDGNISEYIQNNANLSQLAHAIQVADISDVVFTDDPLTVFAPSDEAFDNVPDAELDALLSNKKQLTDILKYHATGETVWYIGMQDGDNYNSLQGYDIIIVKEMMGETYIKKTGYATIITTDISTTNGVIHIIDRVLKLPSVTDDADRLKNHITLILASLTCVYYVVCH